MSLTTQQWRYVGTSTVSANSVAATLNALYTLGTATTYLDTTTRTPGAGSAWTWSRFQAIGVTEAVYATPPTDTLNHRIILAGAAGAKTPLMASPDTYSANIVMASLCKNSGAFDRWDHATQPFTSGNPFGYWKCALTTAINGGKVHLFECQESVIVVFETPANTYSMCQIGAFIDPESSDVTSDSESDGRLYGMTTTGSTTVWATTFWAPTNAAPWYHSAVNGNYHTGIFTPGAGTLINVVLQGTAIVSLTTTFGKTRSGRYVQIPVLMRGFSAAPNDVMIGRLREVFVFNNQILGSKQTNGGTTIGFCISPSNSVASHTAFLKY